MATTDVRAHEATGASAGKVDLSLEVVVLPLSDLSRAAEFYGRLGWRKDADIASGESRVLQAAAAVHDSRQPAASVR